MRHSHRNLFLTVILLATLSGCVSLEKPAPEKGRFVLETVRPGARRLADNKRLLSVRKFEILDQYASINLVYRTGDFAYKSDFYNEFYYPPENMVCDTARLWLDRSGLFAHTVDTSTRMEPTHILEGSIQVLHGDFRNAEKPLAVMQVELLLIDDTRAAPSIATRQIYLAKQPLQAASPEALIEGYSLALTSILEQFENDLRGFFEKKE